MHEVKVLLLTLPMKMEQTQCSETSVREIQKPWYHSKERIFHVRLSARQQVSTIDGRALEKF